MVPLELVASLLDAGENLTASPGAPIMIDAPSAIRFDCTVSIRGDTPSASWFNFAGRVWLDAPVLGWLDLAVIARVDPPGDIMSIVLGVDWPCSRDQKQENVRARAAE